MKTQLPSHFKANPGPTSCHQCHPVIAVVVPRAWSWVGWVSWWELKFCGKGEGADMRVHACPQIRPGQARPAAARTHLPSNAFFRNGDAGGVGGILEWLGMACGLGSSFC